MYPKCTRSLGQGSAKEEFLTMDHKRNKESDEPKRSMEESCKGNINVK